MFNITDNFQPLTDEQLTEVTGGGVASGLPCVGSQADGLVTGVNGVTMATITGVNGITTSTTCVTTAANTALNGITAAAL
jgi:hypothetical protein